MSYAEFQERFEREGEAEYERYLALPAETLVEAVRAGRFGEYYSIWRAIAVNASVVEAGWPLYDVVAGGGPYLIRYHAAGALLSLLRSRRFVAADLAVESPRKREWIGAVRAELEALSPRR
jgi:hypothetical protein